MLNLRKSVPGLWPTGRARRRDRAGPRLVRRAGRRRSGRTAPTGPAALRRAPAAARAIRIRPPSARRRTWRKAGYPAPHVVQKRGALRSYHFLGAAQAAFKHFAQALVDGLTRSKNSRSNRAHRAFHGGRHAFLTTAL